MEANLAMNKFRIRDTSETVQVPSNDLAKLMYYLHCVYDVLKLEDLTPYMDYQYYNNLSDEKKSDIIYYSKLFNPNKMLLIKAFIQDDNIENNNIFLEITDETYGIHANEEFVIEGKVVRISKLMVYKSIWAINNYYFPLQRLTNPPSIPQPTRFFAPPPYIYYTNNNKNSVDDCLCSCSIF